MELNYEFLKANVVEVEVQKELNMGDIEDFMDQVNGVISEEIAISDNEEAIIMPGAKGKFRVQPHNNWYEMCLNGYWFDVALEDDELNEFIKGLNVVGPNPYFAKEA